MIPTFDFLDLSKKYCYLSLQIDGRLMDNIVFKVYTAFFIALIL
jgi:hypothetical protein